MVTVRQVATHTVASTTYDAVVMSMSRVATFEEDMIKRYGTIFWRPKDHFDYSNIGYGVLDHMIQHVSGISFSSFLTRHIFELRRLDDDRLPAWMTSRRTASKMCRVERMKSLCRRHVGSCDRARP